MRHPKPAESMLINGGPSFVAICPKEAAEH